MDDMRNIRRSVITCASLAVALAVSAAGYAQPTPSVPDAKPSTSETLGPILPTGIPSSEIPPFAIGGERVKLVSSLRSIEHGGCNGLTSSEVATLVKNITKKTGQAEGARLANLVITENTLSLRELTFIIIALAEYDDGIRWLRLISKYSDQIAGRVYDMYLENGGGRPQEEPGPHIASIADTIRLAIVDASKLAKSRPFIELLEELARSSSPTVADSASSALRYVHAEE